MPFISTLCSRFMIVSGYFTLMEDQTLFVESGGGGEESGAVVKLIRCKERMVIMTRLISCLKHMKIEISIHSY